MKLVPGLPGAGERNTIGFNKLINKNNRLAAEKFFERHGPITIVIGRFIPFIRTLCSICNLVEAKCNFYGKFITYNCFWVVCFGLVLFYNHRLFLW